MNSAFFNDAVLNCLAQVMDKDSKDTSYTYCGVHRDTSVRNTDTGPGDALGTVWQKGDKTVFLDFNGTMLADSKLGVSEDQATGATHELLSASAAVNFNHKQLEDFPVVPTCSIPMAAIAKTTSKQATLKRPTAFRPMV
jgi:hypothetical protein